MEKKYRKKYSFEARLYEEGKNVGEQVIYCEKCHEMNKYDSFYSYKENTQPPSEKLLNAIITNSYYAESQSDAKLILAQYLSTKKDKAYLQRIVHHDKDLLKELDEIQFNYRDSKNVLLTCPHCGHIVKQSKLISLKRSKDSHLEYNTMINRYSIEEKDNKIIVSVCFISIFPVVEYKKLKYRTINVRFVFNNDDKNVYCFQAYDWDKNKPLYKNTKRILNITYMCNTGYRMSSFHFKAMKHRDLLNDLLKFICKKYDKDVNSVFGSNNWDFKDLLMFYRYPELNSNIRNKIKTTTDVTYISSASIRQKRKVTLQELFKMQNDRDYFYKVFKQKKCPQKKKFIKKAFENPLYIYCYNYLKKCGMKDYNVILDILSNEYLLNFIFTFYIGMYDIYADNSKVYKSFFSTIIEEKGDIFFKNFLLSNNVTERTYYNENILADTLDMYSHLVEWNEFNFKDYIGTLREMHDSFSSLMSKMSHPNRNIPYKQDDLNMNDIINNFYFVLAPNTYSLIDCGEKLGICVGGYDNRAVRKQCNIMFVMHEGKYVGCLEFDSNLNRLVQAKAKYNRLLTGEAAVALKEYVEKHSVDGDCYDFKNLDVQNADIFRDDINYSITSKLLNPDEVNKDIQMIYEYEVIDKKNNSK